MKKIITIFVLLLFVYSCKKADADCSQTAYSYNAEVKELIDKNCNVAGCHDAGATIGDFSSYANMKPFLDNGQVKERLVIKQDMPKLKIIPLKEYNILQCWIEGSYPEN